MQQHRLRTQVYPVCVLKSTQYPGHFFPKRPFCAPNTTSTGFCDKNSDHKYSPLPLTWCLFTRKKRLANESLTYYWVVLCPVVVVRGGFARVPLCACGPLWGFSRSLSGSEQANRQKYPHPNAPWAIDTAKLPLSKGFVYTTEEYGDGVRVRHAFSRSLNSGLQAIFQMLTLPWV